MIIFLLFVNILGYKVANIVKSENKKNEATKYKTRNLKTKGCNHEVHYQKHWQEKLIFTFVSLVLTWLIKNLTSILLIQTLGNFKVPIQYIPKFMWF